MFVAAKYAGRAPQHVNSSRACCSRQIKQTAGIRCSSTEKHMRSVAMDCEDSEH